MEKCKSCAAFVSKYRTLRYKLRFNPENEKHWDYKLTQYSKFLDEVIDHLKKVHLGQLV